MLAEGLSILLLGGSRQQVIAIETAKRLGARTVLCDYLPDNPGQDYADAFYQVSTTDFDAVLEVARREHVAGILAYASDPAAPTAAYVAQKLQLPANPLNSILTLSTKHLFRDHLKKAGLFCPAFASLTAASSDAELFDAVSPMRFPVVVKPSDSSGSKGVSIVESYDETALRGAFSHAKGFTRNGILIVEEFVKSGFPRVIGGDVFVMDGKVAFWGLMSCLRDKALGGLVPVGERYPSGLSCAQEAAVREAIQALVDSLELSFGEFNVEIILGEGDVPFILEFGARAGGNMIPVQLSDIASIDLVEANVRCALGDYSMPVSFGGNNAAVVTYVLHAAKEGVFEGVDIADEVASFAYRTVMYVKPGERIEPFDAANKALGIVFLRFSDPAEMEACLPALPGAFRARLS